MNIEIQLSSDEPDLYYTSVQQDRSGLGGIELVYFEREGEVEPKTWEEKDRLFLTADQARELRKALDILIPELE